MARLEREAIYQFIVEFCTESAGVPPTLRRIGKEFGVSSTSHISYHLRKLEEAGKIARVPDTQIYRVVGARWLPPEKQEHGRDTRATLHRLQ